MAFLVNFIMARKRRNRKRRRRRRRQGKKATLGRDFMGRFVKKSQRRTRKRRGRQVKAKKSNKRRLKLGRRGTVLQFMKCGKK